MTLIMPSPRTGKEPKIDPNVFIAPNAVIIGDVTIHKGVNIWFGVIIRGDWGIIEIGNNTSIQENVVIHSDHGKKVSIGSDCIIGHKAMIHGPCIIGNGCLVGIASNVLHNSKMGDGSMLGAGAVLINKEIPSKMLALGVPAKIKKELSKEGILIGEKTSTAYVQNGLEFKKYFKQHPSFINRD
ncbi:MAG: gamma carbonic anhydrase family protein [Candidatus Lokiarchaeota archaeon]|nr:gamma carbonic anhydrase family protein [Candidatus Lokiarchaeota archaeon]